jgi:hypothetical protein
MHNLDGLWKNIQISNIMKISSLAAELFHMDRRTDMAKLIVSFLQVCERIQTIQWNASKEINTIKFLHILL